MSIWILALQSLTVDMIVGKNYTVSFIVYNLGSNGSCDIMSTVDITGSIISSYIPTMFNSDFGCICTSEILIPEEVGTRNNLLYITNTTIH